MAKITEIHSGLDLEFRRLTDEVERAHDFANLVIESSLDGICAYDRNWMYTVWNPTMESITGLKREQVIGKRLLELFPHVRENGMYEVLMRCQAGEVVHVAEVAVKKLRGGQGGYTQSIHIPLKDEFGEIVGGLAIIRDISDQKLAIQELEEKNRKLMDRIGDLELRSKRES